MSASSTNQPKIQKRHPGPPLPLLGAIHVLLFAAGLASVTVFTGGEVFPSPFDPQAAVLRYFSIHAGGVQTSAFFQLGAAVVLGLFSATVVSRLRFLGVRAAGEMIALYGGIGASLALAASSLGMWTLSRIGPAADATLSVHAVHALTFAAGGPAAVAMFGLLAAGVSVTSGFYRLLPRWLVGLGLAVALCAELSTFVLLWPKAMVLLPLARFPGLLWLLGVAVALPARRPARASQASLTPAHP